jgi:hypothetical protein
MRRRRFGEWRGLPGRNDRPAAGVADVVSIVLADRNFRSEICSGHSQFEVSLVVVFGRDMDRDTGVWHAGARHHPASRRDASAVASRLAE